MSCPYRALHLLNHPNFEALSSQKNLGNFRVGWKREPETVPHLSSGSTAITVSGTHLLTMQELRVQAKYHGIETTNVSSSFLLHSHPFYLFKASCTEVIANVFIDMPGDQ